MKWTIRVVVTLILVGLGWAGIVGWGYVSPHQHTITLKRTYPIPPTELWHRLTTPDHSDSQTITIMTPHSPRTWKTVTKAGSEVMTQETIVTPPSLYRVTIRYAPWGYQAVRHFELINVQTGTQLIVTETSVVQRHWVNALMGLTGRHTPLKQELNRLAIPAKTPQPSS